MHFKGGKLGGVSIKTLFILILTAPTTMVVTGRGVRKSSKEQELELEEQDNEED
uniref:HDC10939 n=1 Tax=Drosophila melanogaster TaxID=7227 RepID=Q6IKZ7_DROME|nr:TPA_inf: HDC10939 [Drosophila melanogaster]